jgi:hypothetical protein
MGGSNGLTSSFVSSLTMKWIPTFLAALAIGSPTFLGAVEAVLTEDTSIHPTKAHRSKGRSPFLTLGDEDIYLRFDIFAVLPREVAPSQIAKATVRLYMNKVIRPGACMATALTGFWREELNILPPVQQSRATRGNTHSNVAGGRDAGKFLVLDVTDIVRTWVDDPYSNRGIVIHGANIIVPAILIDPDPRDPAPLGVAQPLIARFDSKENTATGHMPTLQIVLQNAAD